MNWQEENARFATTMWSVVIKAGGQDPTVRESAVHRLCSAYWLPLYAFLRRSGRNQHDAQDIVQGFFLKILQEDLFSKADREQGRLRSFLVTSLRRYETDTFRRNSAKKRGGDVSWVYIDQDGAEEYLQRSAGADCSPEQAFDADWAHAIVKNARDALTQAYRDEGTEDVYNIIRPYLSEVVHDSYQAAAAQLGKSPNAVKMAVSRMRRRYRDEVRRVVAETLPDDGDVDDEINYLMTVAAIHRSLVPISMPAARNSRVIRA